MSRNKKVVKSLTYEGLGFPVILRDVLFYKVRGEWVPKINIEQLAEIAFKMLPSKASKFTGNEIKFIRTYLDKSKLAFAALFKLSHTAVAKWEKSKNTTAPISPSQEIVLRLYLEDYLNVSSREFYKLYKSVEISVYSKEDISMEIAL